MTRTGVFATREETDRLAKMAKEAGETPVIAFSTADGLNGGGASGRSWKRLETELQACAIAHGLNDFTGTYGLDIENCEFLLP